MSSLDGRAVELDSSADCRATSGIVVVASPLLHGLEKLTGTTLRYSRYSRIAGSPWGAPCDFSYQEPTRSHSPGRDRHLVAATGWTALRPLAISESTLMIGVQSKA